MKNVMKPLAKAVVVVLMTVAVAVVLFGGHAKHPSAASAQKRPTAKHGITTVQTQTSKLKPTKAKALKPGKRSEAGTLSQRTRRFISAYYLIKPTDTAASRQARVAAYVDPSTMPLLDLGLSSGTAADQARVSQKMVISGQAVMGQFHSQAQPGHTRLVTVPVLVTSTGTASKSAQFTIHVAMVWQYAGHTWYLTNFDKGGGDAG